MEELKKLKLDELGRASEKEYAELDKKEVVVLLDNIRSAHNVGSILRTTDGFLFKEVIVTGVTPMPPNKDITKTAIGAERTVKIRQVEDMVAEIKKLQENGFVVLGVEQTNQSIKLDELNDHFTSSDKLAYVLGNEVKGVRKELLKQCDNCVEIPMGGTKHSFNVSVCNGIIAWEVSKLIGSKL